MRKEFPAKVKEAAYKRAAGSCEGVGCTAQLTPGKFEYDHDVACDLGGSNDLPNCIVLCSVCHKTKTAKHDLPLITKGRRIRRRGMGIKKRSTFACSRSSKWKKKIDGSVVRR